MSTNHTRRARGRAPAVDLFHFWLLAPEIYAEPEDKVRRFLECVTDDERRALWEQLRETILAEYVAQMPGKRPATWWDHDAVEPRRRLGGVGTPACEVLAYAPAYEYGIPTPWVTPFDVAYYNGRAKDIHGKPIGREFREGHFKGVAVDPKDPPRYESEASYLERHGLFFPGEKERLTAADFEPERVESEEA